MSTFLEWFVLYLVAFPEVQEKFHDDVCSAVGERDATLEDRSRTHFAEATILEVITVYRMSFDTPFVLHCIYT